MNLLIWSVIVSFTNMLSIKFIPKIISWILDYSVEDRKTKNEIELLKNEQSEISIMKEFAKHAKLQRRINKLNGQLKIKMRENASSNLKIKFTCKIALYISSAILNFLFIRYNYNQIVLNELPPNWFSPLSWIVSWPSSQVGTMSFIFWFAVTNYVARLTINNIILL